ncbi:unnamed protein product [Nezara viridula]|uniref:SCP domain-containing protein n=1 Tax=Nezara viridula TaxID=85310 RepID=A0A9P0HQX0_NEZVI|nr:unnamed protein product [Nezara viridula]
MTYFIFQFLLLMRVFRTSEPTCKINEAKSMLSCNDKTTILDLHNKHRDLVAGGKTNLAEARDMWVLQWDENLANEAQEYANKCIYKHDAGKQEGTGENIAWKASYKNNVASVKELIAQWYDEIQYYNYLDLSNIKRTGHFTQMIWADTKYIGCGVVFYEDGTSSKTPYQTMLVCNYQPPGNYVGEIPYKMYEGKRCTRGVQSTKYNNLCAHDEMHANGTYSPPCPHLAHSNSFKIQPTAILLLIFLILAL